MFKSSISQIFGGRELAEETGTVLNCKIAELPIAYLGLPLHHRKVRKEHLQVIIDKIRRRLASWRTFMLAQGERLILVQSVLSAMAIFTLCH
jgi:hypothetical protein